MILWRILYCLYYSPPLIFESAYNLKIEDLKKYLIPIVSLATLGLVMSTLIVGYSFHYLFEWAIFPALVFGALISATDPVAVVALFRELGAPKHLITLVEGESLFNDGTALVMYNLFLILALGAGGEAFSLGTSLVSFLKVVFGGILVGYIMAQLTIGFLRITESSSAAQMGLTVTSSYLSFAIADHTFHVSGIFATLVVGLIMGHRARLELNREALHGMHSVWSLLALGANSMVFLLLGLLVDYQTLWQTLPLIPGAIAIIYLSRAISVPSSLLLNNSFFPTKISKPQQMVLVWGGLRGGLAIALVLLLPADFAYKNTFMSIAIAFVLSTLLLNALTIGRLMSFLSFDKLKPLEQALYKSTLQQSRHKIFKALKAASNKGLISPLVVEIYDKKLQKEVDEVAGDEGALKNQDLQRFLLKEQDVYNRFLEDRELAKKSYLKLTENLNERLEALGEATRNMGQTYRASFLLPESSWWHVLWKLAPKLHRYLRFNDLDSDLEVLFFQYLALSKVREKSQWNEEVEQHSKKWLDYCFQQLHRLFLHYPQWAKHAQARFISTLLNAGMEHNYEHLLHLGIINQSVFAKADVKRKNIVKEWLQDSQQSFKLDVPHLLMCVTHLKSLPQKELHQLSKVAQLEYFEAQSQWQYKEVPQKELLLVIAEGEAYLGPLHKELGPNDSILISSDPQANKGHPVSIECKGEVSYWHYKDLDIEFVCDSEVIQLSLDSFNVPTR